MSSALLTQVLTATQSVSSSRIRGKGPAGKLPLTADDLLKRPSGHVFGLTQNAGMGWDPAKTNGDQFLILSTLGGVRNPDGTPVALGYHTGHWEVGRLVARAAEYFSSADAVPFAAFVSDPCDGRTQGTTGMFDSLPYRNDAAITMRRLIRSLPERRGVLGVATCDKGLPATMMALAGCATLPSVIVPGGVTLPAADAEDAGMVQTLGARFAHELINLEYAAEMGCRACGSTGGGCQFLGTAATSQVVAEALGWTIPHAALAPSGEPAWLALAAHSAEALMQMVGHGLRLSDVLTASAVRNAMVVHAAFGGSTNLLLHIPAIAHAAGLCVPTVQDWQEVNRSTPRLVDALPNGPQGFPTSYVYMAGGVPEVMLHLRQLGLLDIAALTVTGDPLGTVLDAWHSSPRRAASLKHLRDTLGVEPTQVILNPAAASAAGLTSTVVFPKGNLAPEGSVIKATAISPEVVGADGVYRHRGRARVFTSEYQAIAALKDAASPIQPGNVLVLMGVGPLGTGMEETYQLTSALKHLPWGKTIPIVTDARFSGVSTGACIGHVGPEALSGGPIGRVQDGDVLEIEIDRTALTGSVNLVATRERELSANEAAELLQRRPPHPALQPHPELPSDTRLWAALQQASGGTWAGCVYDVDRIVDLLHAGMRAQAASK